MTEAGVWIESLSKPEVCEFLKAHETEDAFELALRFKQIANIPISVITRQLKSRQKASSKLPEWYNTKNIIFPYPELLEQASSEITARYKSKLLSGTEFVDLSGGTGVDSYYLSKNFEVVNYVEPSPFLCELADYNFRQLGASISVNNSSSGEYLRAHPQIKDTLYIDPSRRDDNKNKVYKISDCSPDLTQIKLTAGICLWAKLSPMLDVQEAMVELDYHIKNIYVIAVENEVKELLLQMDSNIYKNPEITAVNILKNEHEQLFNFTKSHEEAVNPLYDSIKKYLYESNAAIRKAGAFKSVAVAYDLVKLERNTHLYSSNLLVPDFPGRSFIVENDISYQPKAIRNLSFKKANISLRNFPMDVASIRKKTGLKDGGEMYLFFYTDIFQKLRVAICRKTR